MSTAPGEQRCPTCGSEGRARLIPKGIAAKYCTDPFHTEQHPTEQEQRRWTMWVCETCGKRHKFDDLRPGRNQCLSMQCTGTVREVEVIEATPAESQLAVLREERDQAEAAKGTAGVRMQEAQMKQLEAQGNLDRAEEVLREIAGIAGGARGTGMSNRMGKAAAVHKLARVYFTEKESNG